jgi:Na+/alanine symporter
MRVAQAEAARQNQALLEAGALSHLHYVAAWLWCIGSLLAELCQFLQLLRVHHVLHTQQQTRQENNQQLGLDDLATVMTCTGTYTGGGFLAASM